MNSIYLTMCVARIKWEKSVRHLTRCLAHKSCTLWWLLSLLSYCNYYYFYCYYSWSISWKPVTDYCLCVTDAQSLAVALVLIRNWFPDSTLVKWTPDISPGCLKTILNSAYSMLNWLSLPPPQITSWISFLRWWHNHVPAYQSQKP